MDLEKARLVSVGDVVGRLREGLSVSVSSPTLAFDADGTLWSGDIGNDLFEALLLGRAIRQDAYEALLAEARFSGVSLHGDATDLGRALYEAHWTGQYPEERAFAMMAWAFAGYTLAEARAFAADVFARVGLRERLHRFLEPILEWARAEDVPVWVVSASPLFAVQMGVSLLGILPENVVAMQPRVLGDRIAPELAAPAVYGPAKPTSFFAACPGRELLGAFGDSSYDAALLAASRVPVAVRPKPGLLARAAEVTGLLVLEG